VSLDVSKLERVRTNGAKTTARCPACAEAGDDQKGEHLFIYADDRFGCVVYPGDSADANAHRRRIFALCDNREFKPLVVRRTVLGRSGRENKGCPAGAPLKTRLLGCLGQVFETYLAGKQTHERRGDRKAEKLNDCEKGVLPVLQTHAPMKPHRPLTERERRLLVALSGCEQDRIIIDALDHQVLSMCSSIFS
jgi:hypothetical protein